MPTYKDRQIDRVEIIGKIKKYFPQFAFNEDETILNVYNNKIHIPTNWTTAETYFGLYVGGELLSMIIEQIVWRIIEHENNLNLKENVEEILKISERMISKLIEEGIFDAP
jgi:hypothetical protein